MVFENSTSLIFYIWGCLSFGVIWVMEEDNYCSIDSLLRLNVLYLRV